MWGDRFSPQAVKSRLTFLDMIIIASFVFLLVYLFYLQIIRGFEFQKLSRNVAFRESKIPTQRGEIFDRHYDSPLVVNTEVFSLYLVPAQVAIEKVAYLEKLALFLGLSTKEIHTKVPAKSYKLYQPVEIMADVPFEKLAYIAEHEDEFPGLSWSSKLKREYIYTNSFSHLLGYVNIIDPKELEILYNLGYNENSIIGKTGIESRYDQILRGKDGKILRLADVRERRLGLTSEEIPPEPGKQIVLSIDRHIQKLCEDVLSKRKGAAVVLAPATGEIYALVSMPAFNANRILEKDYYDKLRLDPRNPLYNRAISPFPPASAFKVVMTTAILQEKTFPQDKKIFCSGSITIGDRRFRCWKETGHGWLNLAEGLANSCNNYFQTVGVNYLGIENIIKYARDYGFGTLTGIDLNGEKRGFLPTPEWKEDTEGMIWLGGDTANISIGQGYITATPLQMACMVAMIVNNGLVYRPHLVKEIRDPQTGNIISRFNPELLRKTSLVSTETYRVLKEMMRGVCVFGTARPVMTSQAVKIAGKTGTSEQGIEKSHLTHEWFVGFAPFDATSSDKQLVVVVFVEDVPKNEWWAPRMANYIFHGIFTNKSLIEVEKDLGKLYWKPEDQNPEE